LDASDDLAARDPWNLFHSIENAVKDVGKVASKGLHVAESIADNPLVQAAASFIPGESQVVAAGKVIGGAIGQVEKFENIANKANEVRRKVEKLVPSSAKGRKIEKAIRSAKQVIAPPRPPRRHRRDLEDSEELSRRELGVEELFGREYDDFLVERDFFDDLD